MKKTLFFLTVLLLGAGTSFGQTTEVEGYEIPSTLKAGSTTLMLNGGGLREKLWIDLYVGGLYLKAKSSDANKIMAADEAMCIRIEIVSSLITSDKMVDAVEEGFKKSTGGRPDQFRAEIDAFTNCFKLYEITKGNVYEITYIPGTGVQVSIQGKVLDTITGLDFKKALFGIWLSNDPADEDLKEGMLGLD